MMKRGGILLGCVVAVLVWTGCGGGAKMVYQAAYYDEIAGFDKKAVVVPVTRMRTRYRDNTRADPDTAFVDSALQAVANAFLRREGARFFTPLPIDSAAAARDSTVRFSVIDTTRSGDSAAVATFVRDLCATYDADIVVLPYAFTAGSQVRQDQGWRRQTGPGYARPIQERGFARFHVQIWDRSGKLLFERVAQHWSKKPMLYGWFNGPRMRARRHRRLDDDPVREAAKFFAPPIMRAVGKAVEASFYLR